MVSLIHAEAPLLKGHSDNTDSTSTQCDDGGNDCSGSKRKRTEDLSLDDIYLVFELVDTDLYKLIMSPECFTSKEIQSCLYQILRGLLYLHSANVIHRLV